MTAMPVTWLEPRECPACGTVFSPRNRNHRFCTRACTIKTAHQLVVTSGPVFDEGDTSWMPYAACVGVDPDIFFPKRGDDVNPAKAICATCEVRDDCLSYAMRNHENVGVWGGLSERQRRGMRRKKKTT